MKGLNVYDNDFKVMKVVVLNKTKEIIVKFSEHFECH